MTDYAGARVTRYTPGDPSLFHAEYNGLGKVHHKQSTEGIGGAAAGCLAGGFLLGPVGCIGGAAVGFFEDGTHAVDWTPTAPTRATVCGTQHKYNYNAEGPDTAIDWNWLLFPSHARFYPPTVNPGTGANGDTCSVPSVAVASGSCCPSIHVADGQGLVSSADGHTKYLLDVELTPNRAFQDYMADNLGWSKCSPNALGRCSYDAWGDCHTRCAYGVPTMDSGHNNKPELHPAEVLWWQWPNGGNNDEFFVSAVSADHRFNNPDDFPNKPAPGEWDYPIWKPWQQAPFYHWYRVPFTVPDPTAGGAPAHLTITGYTGHAFSWITQSPADVPTVSEVGDAQYGNTVTVDGRVLATVSDNGGGNVANGVSWSHLCIDHRYFPAQVRGLLNIRTGLNSSANGAESYLYFSVGSQGAHPPPMASPPPPGPPPPTVAALCTGQMIVQIPPPAANTTPLASGTVPPWTYYFQRLKHVDASTPGAQAVYGPYGALGTPTYILWETVGPRIAVAAGHNLPLIYADTPGGANFDSTGILATPKASYRACVSDYVGQESCSMATIVYHVPSCHSFTTWSPAGCNTTCVIPLGCTPCTSSTTSPLVEPPFDPHTSCGGGACLQSPPRPKNLNNRIVSIVSAKTPSYTLRSAQPPQRQFWSMSNLSCLDIAHGDYTSGTTVNAFPCHSPLSPDPNSMLNQQWIVTTIPSASYVADSFGLPARNPYILRSLGNPNLCLDVRGGTQTGGEAMQIFNCANLATPSVPYALNQTFSLPGAFSFDSTAGTPDLHIRSFGYQSLVSAMCVDAYDPAPNPSGVSAVTSSQCLGFFFEGSHSYWYLNNDTNWILYDWVLQSFL
jgi:hypothetical protein